MSNREEGWPARCTAGRSWVLLILAGLTAVLLAGRPASAQDPCGQPCPGYGQAPAAPVPAPVPAPPALRQCKGVYFSPEFSAWFTVDCLVVFDQALPGTLVMGEIPGLGARKLWLLDVYQVPKVNPPTLPERSVSAVSAESPRGPVHGDATASRSGSGPGSARIVLTLPEGATLTVNGRRVAASAGRQEVVVKDLAAGTAYEYQLLAAWQQAGRPLRAGRTISFAAGSVVTVDFTATGPSS